jgi:ZIP family zinc transporter
MDSFWLVVLLALMPAAGNFAGGLIAEKMDTTPIILNRSLHAAAGVVIAIVAVELMPRALDVLAAWVLGFAFALGGIAYLGMERLVGVIQRRSGSSGRLSGMWMIYIAVVVDLFSDGLMIGAGSAVSVPVAITLAAGQVLADIPEGFASIANMKEKGVARSKRLLLSASFAIPVLLAAVLAYFILRDQAESLKLAVLIFTAGLLTVAAVEEMLSEAHESHEDSQISVLAFIAGFVLFVLVSAGLESMLQPEGKDAASSAEPATQHALVLSIANAA